MHVARTPHSHRAVDAHVPHTHTRAQRKCTGVFRTREKTLGSFKPLLFVYLPFSIPSPTPFSILDDPSSIASPTPPCIPPNPCGDLGMCLSPWTHTPTYRDPEATGPAYCPETPETPAHTDVAQASEETSGAPASQATRNTSATRNKSPKSCARDIFAIAKPKDLLSETTPATPAKEIRTASSGAALAQGAASERSSASGADPAEWRMVDSEWRTLVDSAVNGLHLRFVCLCFVLWGSRRRVGAHASDSSSAWGTAEPLNASDEPRTLALASEA